MELDVLAVYGKPCMFMAHGTRYNGCIWEILMFMVDGTRCNSYIWETLDVYGRWN